MFAYSFRKKNKSTTFCLYLVHASTYLAQWPLLKSTLYWLSLWGYCCCFLGKHCSALVDPLLLNQPHHQYPIPQAWTYKIWPQTLKKNPRLCAIINNRCVKVSYIITIPIQFKVHVINHPYRGDKTKITKKNQFLIYLTSL